MTHTFPMILFMFEGAPIGALLGLRRTSLHRPVTEQESQQQCAHVSMHTFPPYQPWPAGLVLPAAGLRMRHGAASVASGGRPHLERVANA